MVLAEKENADIIVHMVSISYIGMVQQHLVVEYIITPIYCFVKCRKTEKQANRLVNERFVP